MPLRLSIFLTAAMLVLAGGAQAQLAPTFWSENISLDVQAGIDNQNTSFMGADMEAPESHTEQLTGNDFEVTGSVLFGTTAVPEGTAQVTWDISPVGASLNLSSILNIDFQARVIETATPPVSVSEVPVRIVSNGSVAVEQFFGPRATSSFQFRVLTTTVLVTGNLDLYGDPESTTTTDSFSIDQVEMVPPNLVALVSMTATASMGTVGTGGAATGAATAMIDPIIEVADQTIPGTSDSYRDYYTIEFSPGYDAQTPVKKTTFGQIKRRYTNPR